MFGGVLYTVTLHCSHYLCFTCSPWVCSGSVTKKVAYYHPPEELSAHVPFGNCCRLTSRLNWTWHWAIIRKWNAVFAIMGVWQGPVNTDGKRIIQLHQQMCWNTVWCVGTFHLKFNKPRYNLWMKWEHLMFFLFWSRCHCNSNLMCSSYCA